MGEDGAVSSPTSTDGYYQGYPSPPRSQPAHTGISRPVWITLVLVIGLLTGFGLMHAIPVDKVVFRPGPVFNTLGPGSDSEPMIQIEGLETYPTSGDISLTTVIVFGGPGQRVSLWDWASASFNSEETVVDRSEVYPDEDTTRDEITERNEAAMQSSQSSAEIVALRAAGIPERVEILGTVDDSPATGLILPGDVLVAVDDVEVNEAVDAQDALQEVTLGDSVPLTVQRDGEQITVEVTPEQQEVEVAAGVFEERMLIGVTLGPVFDGDFSIDINAGAVGGPSAGLMFSLAIYDKLTPGELTGDLRFAGTGTIAADGAVGPIGGIRQKMAASATEGYDYFLAPRANCPDVVGHEPDGIEVVAVDTFEQALEMVEDLGAGEDVDLPRCTT